MTRRVQELVTGVARRDRLALARALTQIENQTDIAEDIIDGIAGYTGTAARIGITGPPGAGKSTLIRALSVAWRRRGETVGIVAVDPTSALTGGALLGDRVRMVELAGDDGVFMRSMASRGRLGGLGPSTAGAIDLLDAAGFSRVLVETVGVGQTDIEVAEATDLVVVVLVPEAGDAVQGMKAGLLELADLIVINKADREGAGTLERALHDALSLRTLDRASPAVFRTVAPRDEGIDELVTALDATLAASTTSGERQERRRAALRRRLAHLMRDALLERAGRSIDIERTLDDLSERVLRGGVTPRRAVAAVVDALG